MIEIPVDATVECADGHAGRSSHVIIDPVKRIVTHFVVTDDDPVTPHSWLVPIDQVSATSHKSIKLACTLEELAAMEPFLDVHFLKSDTAEEDYPADAIFLSPYVTPLRTDYVSVETEHIPQGELAIRRGATVEATDGKVGVLGEFLIDPDSGHVTHFVLQEGHLWGKKEVTVPVSAIDRTLESTVFLKLNRSAIDKLPAVPLQRHYAEAGKPGGLELMARVYDNMEKAGEMLQLVKNLQKEKVLKLRDAAVLVKDEEGKTSVRETADIDARHGGLFGAVVGGLIGLPAGPIGIVVGALAGATTGSVAAKRIDMGFSNEFLESFKRELKPGTSALIILVEHHWREWLADALGGVEGVEFSHTLSDRMVEEMLEAADEDKPDDKKPV
jgi:uncharacterized membrane protein